MNPRPSVLAVTGTDTGVGKTRVSRALLRALTAARHPVAPLKLVETGCATDGDTLIPEDGLALARAARREDALALIAPERFTLPAAPLTAAREVGRTLDRDALLAHVAAAHTLAPRVLLEGAGGWLVPFAPGLLFGDLVAHLGAPVVLVARDALGTINHTLLTAESIRARGVRLAAVVLDAVGAEPCGLGHARELRALLPDVPVYGPMPWGPGADDDQLAEQIAALGLEPGVALGLWGRGER